MTLNFSTNEASSPGQSCGANNIISPVSGDMQTHLLRWDGNSVTRNHIIYFVEDKNKVHGTLDLVGLCFTCDSVYHSDYYPCKYFFMV